MGKKRKKTKDVVNKKKDKDIVVKIDKLTGRLPMSTRGGQVMQGDKKNTKKDRKKWKKDLKRYVESNEEST